MRGNFPKYIFQAALALLLILAVSVTFGQTIRTSIDKKSILIGEQITYRMSIGLPSADYKVELNIPDSIPHFDVIQKAAGSATDKKGNYSWEYKLVFTSFDSGTWHFPILTYRINHFNTASQALATDAFFVNVGYMPTDAGGNPRDIKTVLDVSYFDWFWIYLGAGILAFLAIAFFAYRYFKNRKTNGPPPTAAEAYAQAMHELETLRKANASNSLPVKEFHTRLADVLKNYYSRKEGGNFLNKTTSEILAKLRSYQLKAETESHTAEALKTGDAVKFAKYHSSYTENEAALNYVQEVIGEIERSLTKKD